MKFKYVILVCFVFFSFYTNSALAQQNDPVGLILTWQQDPTTTMTIDWHTKDEHASTLEYKRVGASVWDDATGENFPFPYSDRTIHRVELTGLEPDTEYRIRFTEGADTWKFRTMPTRASRPIRFATGGDVRHEREMMEKTNRHVASMDPDFIVWGGDLAYANGLEERLYRWYEYMEVILNTLVTDDGRMIPILAGIGNHEVLAGYYYNEDSDRREGFPPYEQNDESRERIAPYYFKLFAFPGQPGYGVLDFGDYMSIILLDTDHTNPVAGKQTRWLEETLAERQDVPHVFPTYHVPAYPVVRNPEWSPNVEIRKYWVPLFEMYGVRVAFENHDHAYKRTHPLRNGEIRSDGIVYIGDGAWGVRTRDPGRSHEEYAYYLNRVASQRHFILATIYGRQQHFIVINEDGQIIDEYPSTPHTKIDEAHGAVKWSREKWKRQITEEE